MVRKGATRVVEVVGVSDESWDCAARRAVATATDTVRDLRGVEVIRQDVVVEDGVITGFRVRLAVSYRPGPCEPPIDDLGW